MSDQQTPITEDEIHAYVDGSLAEHRREEIDRLLEQRRSAGHQGQRLFLAEQHVP